MTEQIGGPVSSAPDLAPYAEDVAAFLSSRRSKKLLRLFMFLLDQSQRGRQTGEAEIAASLRSGHDAAVDPPGSSGRVYVSRLRKMLDQYYAGHSGARLIIPRGEYRLALQAGAHDPPAPAPVEDIPAAAPQNAQRKTHLQLLLACLAGLNAVLAGLYWYSGTGEGTLAQTALWQPLARSRMQTIVVVGDHFLFGERRAGKVDRIVRDLRIANRAELGTQYALSVRGADGPVDLDLAYTSSNLVFALRSVRLALNAANVPSSVIPASQLDPAMLKSSNIVYLGPLDGLGPVLGTGLSRVSGFALRASDGALLDKQTRASYRSDLALVSATSVPLRDYGYIASFPGPSGNRIVILSGLGDAGLTQMGDLAVSKADLARLAAVVAGSGASDKAEAFEALYQVKALYSESFGRSLVVARNLGTRNFWDTTPPSGQAVAGRPL
jgi:hypothetical protein